MSGIERKNEIDPDSNLRMAASFGSQRESELVDLTAELGTFSKIAKSRIQFPHRLVLQLLPEGEFMTGVEKLDRALDQLAFSDIE